MDNINITNDQCPICLNPVRKALYVETTCKHIFCINCIVTLLEYHIRTNNIWDKIKCPYCQQIVDHFSIISNDDDYSNNNNNNIDIISLYNKEFSFSSKILHHIKNYTIWSIINIFLLLFITFYLRNDNTPLAVKYYCIYFKKLSRKQEKWFCFGLFLHIIFFYFFKFIVYSLVPSMMKAIMIYIVII